MKRYEATSHAEIDKIFNSIDVDENGSITVEELETCLRTQKFPLSRENIISLGSQMDADKVSS